MRLAAGLLSALLVMGQGGAGPAVEDADPARVAEFVATPGARTGCVKLDVPEARGLACFDVQVTAGADPSRDVFTWRMTARATATEGRRLVRLKVRLSGHRQSLADWAPQGRRDVGGEPVTVGLPGSDAPVGFRPHAGRLVSYADDDLYHVAWAATAASGRTCCGEAEVGGITAWSVPRGTGMRGLLRIEAWVR